MESQFEKFSANTVVDAQVLEEVLARKDLVLRKLYSRTTIMNQAVGNQPWLNTSVKHVWNISCVIDPTFIHDLAASY